jgi:hypothetical protein
MINFELHTPILKIDYAGWNEHRSAIGRKDRKHGHSQESRLLAEFRTTAKSQNHHCRNTKSDPSICVAVDLCMPEILTTVHYYIYY